MKKSSYFLFLESIILITLLILNSLIFNITELSTFVMILGAFLLVTVLFCGYERNTYRYKNDIFLTLFINLCIYFIVTYMFGLLTGFYANGYSLTITSIIKNSFIYLILYLLIEFYRYEFFTKSKHSKILIVLGFIIFVLFDVNLSIHLYDIKTLEGIVKMVCLVIFPSIAKNIFLSYLTTSVGYGNAIFYSLVMNLKRFVLPIFPDFGEYINTMVDVIFPIYLTLMIRSKLSFNEDRKIRSSRYYNNKVSLYLIISVILFVIVALTSGYFNYQALTIGSHSMEKKISKGDVVVVKKIPQDKLDTIEIGDVLVYHCEGKIIVHRLIETKEVNGEKVYITKGDNNIARDGYFTYQKDIIGIVSFRIKYIGIPTVALNEALNN